MSVAVIRFSGSNCDQDTLYVYKHLIKAPVISVWQDEADLPAQTKAVIIPGGFSFGDYLRAGAMAAHRPIMKAVKRFALAGGPTLGVCNGFQILCESKILPGVLLPNHTGRFICVETNMIVRGGGVGALRGYKKNEKIVLPIAHHDGRYFANQEELLKLKNEDMIALQYEEVDQYGNATVNGSAMSIAGIFGGPSRNVLGLMPHPERRSEDILGGSDGLRMLQSLVL